MLEVHPDPTNSAVDPLQPIDYQEFSNLIKNINSLKKTLYKN